MQKKILHLTIVLATIFSVNGQTNIGANYHSPLGIPLILAANFGEIRPNHFHMGLDFKTRRTTGYKIYAIEDGYVSRIKVSPYGYGRVVYIDHPDGRTSVYAHCLEFKGAIDSIVKKVQYDTENYEVEIFPERNEIPVEKGQVIAISGNSGGSTAPHLHFEIRETESEHCLNPLVFGFDIADSRSPEIRRVKAFAVNEDGYLIPKKEKALKSYRSKNGSYRIQNNQLTVPASFCTPNGGIGLAFDIIDRLDGANNPCGLYGTYLIVDGDTIFGQKTDEISFDETRYVNSHTDYTSYKERRRKYHKSFRNKSNPLLIYTTEELGIIHAQPGDSKNVQLVAYDPKDNSSTLEFELTITGGTPSEDYVVDTTSFLVPEYGGIMQQEDWMVDFPKGTLYEPRKEGGGNTAHFCTSKIPIQENIAVYMRLDQASSPPDKYYIEVEDRALATSYKDGYLIATSKYAGDFHIRKDVDKPIIRGKSFNSSHRVSGNTVRLSVHDNGSGLEEYDLYINDKWHLMGYDYKGGGSFSFERPESMAGKNKIKIVASDACGNRTVYVRTLDFR